jgi:citrate synthase
VTIDPEHSNGASWRTAIGVPLYDEVIIRGFKLTDLIGSKSFAEMFGLVLRGDEPTAAEGRVIDALLVSVMEHGISPSSMVSRMLATYGVPIQAGVAAGTLTIGDIHGGAGLHLAELLKKTVADYELRACPPGEERNHLQLAAADVVENYRKQGLRVEGFGHPQHLSDPRCAALLELAKREQVSGIHTALLISIGHELNRSIGRHVPINVDGVVASLILDLGFDPRVARLLVLVGRSVGLGAHFIEEQDMGTRWRHVSQDEVIYEGPIFS